MAALAVSMYDEFVSDTLQPELVELRVLDENEVDLVSGQSALALVLGFAVCVVVIGITVGFVLNRDPPYNPPQPRNPPPLPR
jgi:hypothetical protein